MKIRSGYFILKVSVKFGVVSTVQPWALCK